MADRGEADSSTKLSTGFVDNREPVCAETATGRPLACVHLVGPALLYFAPFFESAPRTAAMKSGIHPDYKDDQGDLQLREHLRDAFDARPGPADRSVLELPPVLHGQAEDRRHRRSRRPVPQEVRAQLPPADGLPVRLGRASRRAPPGAPVRCRAWRRQPYRELCGAAAPHSYVQDTRSSRGVGGMTSIRSEPAVRLSSLSARWPRCSSQRRPAAPRTRSPAMHDRRDDVGGGRDRARPQRSTRRSCSSSGATTTRRCRTT